MNNYILRFIYPEGISTLFNLRVGERPISWRAFGVGVALASFMNQEGVCWPSRRAIANRTGIDLRAVTRGIRELEESGFIEAKHRAGKTTVYFLSPSQIAPPGHSDTPGQIDQAPPGQIDHHPLGQSAPQKEPMKKPMKELLDSLPPNGSPTEAPPPDLVGLELYETDNNLCKTWPSLLTSWERAHPNLDIITEVARAHAWEVANPHRRKKNRASFLSKWLARAEENRNALSAEVDQREAEFERASYAYSESGFEDTLTSTSQHSEQ